MRGVVTVQGRLWTITLIMALLCATTAAWAESHADPYTAPTAAKIDDPKEGSVWVAGASVSCGVEEAMDMDRTYSDTAEPPWEHFHRYYLGVDWTTADTDANHFGDRSARVTTWSASVPGHYTLTVTPSLDGGTIAPGEARGGTSSRSIWAVRVDKLQYAIAGGGSGDVDGANPIYVPVGVEVTFTAVPTPSGAPKWPNAKPTWGGSSGASGTGASVKVTFSGPSSSTSDYKTVTATCGNTVTANVVVCQASIYQDEIKVSGTATTEVVGRRVLLQGSLLPTGLTVSGHSWTVTGYAVAGWNADADSGDVVPLTQLTDSSVDIYWVDGGTKNVSYTATVNGSSLVNATAIFCVLRPTATVTVTTNDADNVQMIESIPALVFIGEDSPGIDFRVTTFTKPPGWDPSWTHEFMWVQIVETTMRRHIDADWNQEHYHKVGVLDSTYPYESGDYAEDSPSKGGFADDLYLTVTDSFSMYLMFQPGGSSIPVPLYKMTWSWSGDASNDDGWVINEKSAAHSAPADCTAFPHWDDNALPFVYHPVD